MTVISADYLYMLCKLIFKGVSMKKYIKIFCNRFKCLHNEKGKCTAQKIIGKRSECLFYTEYGGER